MLRLVVQGGVTISIEVRRAYSDDAEAMAELRSLFGASNRTASYYRWKVFDNPLGEGKAWVADDKGKVVGMRLLTPKGNDLYWCGDGFIHPDYQRRGIFTELLAVSKRYRIYGTPSKQALTPNIRQGYLPAPIELRSYIGFHMGCRAERGLPDVLPRDPNFLVDKTLAYLTWRYAGYDSSGYSFWHTDGGYSVRKGRLLVDYAATDEDAFRRLIPNGIVRTWAVKGSMYDSVLLKLGFVPLSKITVIHNGFAWRGLLTWGDSDSV